MLLPIVVLGWLLIIGQESTQPSVHHDTSPDLKTLPNSDSRRDQAPDIASRPLPVPQPKHRATLGEILEDQGAWGKDFSKALSETLLLQAIGETTVEVNPHSVVGATRYLHQREAMEAQSKLRLTVGTKESSVDQQVDSLLGSPSASVRSMGEIGFHEEREPTFSATPNANLLAIENKSLRFLKVMTLEDMKARWGDPDKISYQRVPTEGEDREEILTSIQYAGGALTFVVSNLSPIPVGKSQPIVSKVIISTKEVSDLVNAQK